MMRTLLAFGLFLTLAACGVDGAPERPEPGVKVGGDAYVGIMYDG